MANEITAVEGSGPTYTLFFVVQIPTPIQVGGANVVPTPANEGSDSANPSVLPDIVDRVITTTERNALNSGAGIWGTQTLRIIDDSGERIETAALASRVRELYAAWKPEVLAEYQRRYEFSGIRLNEVA